MSAEDASALRAPVAVPARKSRFTFDALSSGSITRFAIISSMAFSTAEEYADKEGYRSSIDSRGAPEFMRSALVFGNGMYCPAASQPSFACGPDRRAQPVYVASGTVTSG